MNIVILAAGQGKRMHSNLPKVLHPVAGKALAQHVAPRPKRPAIRATWEASAGWQEAVQALRREGETVAVTLPGQEHAPEEFVCDRVLTRQDGRWLLQAV